MSKPIPPYPSRPVTYHRSRCQDMHHNVAILAGPGGLGGAPTDYLVRMVDGEAGFDLARLKFQTKPVQTPTDIDGLTNEVLLAVVEDRLQQFQEGACPCRENENALHHLRQAMSYLQERTARRKSQGVEGSMNEPNPSTTPDVKHAGCPSGPEGAQGEPGKRVSIGRDGLIIAGPNFTEIIGLKSLEAWGGWSRVEHAVKRLVKGPGTALTKEELEVIESCATGRGGKSGYAEFAQAYRQHVGQ